MRGARFGKLIQMRLPVVLALLLAVLLSAYLLFGREDVTSFEAERDAQSATLDPLEEGVVGNNSGTRAEPDLAGIARAAVASDQPVRTLQLVDEADGKALIGLPYRMLELGSAEEVLASGVTDAAGHVDLQGVPSGIVVVETPRHPPVACAAQVVDLSDAGQMARVIQIARGGSISGLVQDAEGLPIDGVPIYARNGHPGLGDPPPVGAAERPVATTDERGRFEAHALASRPRSVSAKDGVALPKYWEPVALYVPNPLIKGGPIGQAYEQLEQGQQLELTRPFVFQRARTLRGRLLGADGQPAADHFVTSNLLDRVRWTGFPPLVLSQAFDYSAEEFTRASNEAITDNAGNFAIEVTATTGFEVWVAGPTGLVERFRGDDACEWIGDCDVGELQLQFDRPILMRLVDTLGDPLEPESFRSTDEQIGMNWRYRQSGENGSVDLLLINDDDRENRPTCQVEVGGVVRFLTPIDPATVRSVGVSSATFRPRRLHLPNGFDPLEPLVVELEPTRILTIHIVAHGAFDDVDEFRLAVHPCAVPPERRAEQLDVDEALASGSKSRDCCGMSSARVWDWRGEDATVRIAGLSDDPFYVYVFGAGRHSELPQLIAGPLRPGADDLTVKINSSDLVAREVALAEPEASPTKAKDRRTSVLATVIDSATGAEVANALAVTHQPGSTMRPSSARLLPRADGGLRAVFLDHGLRALRIEAPGYRSVELGEHLLRAGEATDVGTVSLEAIDPFRVRLLESDGTPLAEGTTVRVPSNFALVGANGLLTVPQDMPQAFLMNIQVGPWDQRIVTIDGWTAGEVREVRIVPLRRVEIVLRGLDSAHDSALMYLMLRPLRLQLERYGDPKQDWHRLPGSWSSVSGDAVRELGTRSFFAQLGAGSYSAELRSSLYSTPDFTIDVVVGEGTQVFEVQAER